MSRDERKVFQHNLVSEGHGYGLLVYDEGTPDAWCQLRISCLFINKHQRWEGLSKISLKAALESIREHDGGVVEAFPLDVPGLNHTHYTGTVKKYIREGFQEVSRLGNSTVLIRKVFTGSRKEKHPVE